MIEVAALIKTYTESYRGLKGTETDWREPVVGVAEAANPKFWALKEIISPTHALPTDFIADARSVIAFFLPYEEAIVKGNIGEVESSRAWDIANIETNQLIIDINIYLNGIITAEGHTSTVLPPTYNYDEKALISDWSHRHVGVIAGIGTFGIHNMLITEKGCCGRMGSIITSMPLSATDLKEEENCLYKHSGACGMCRNRCVAEAISLDEGIPFLDKQRCNAQIYNGNVPVYPIGSGDACGKCMCNVPCSLENPVGKLTDR